MAEIDWNELIQTKKEVMACDNHVCGNVMAEYNDYGRGLYQACY